MKTPDGNSFETRAVHAGERRSAAGVHPVVTPIHPSVGYTFPDSADLDRVLGGEQEGFVYSTRYGNPTVAAFEAAIADLEGTEDAFAFSSGMAAVHMALLGAGLRAGTAVVAAADVYGATYKLLQTVFTGLGARTCFTDVLDLKAVRRTVEDVRPAVLYAETVSNPLLKVADLGALSKIAGDAGAFLLVDNTFCSPYLCNPARLGADMVIHSTTKYLSGHGDAMGGVVATTRELRRTLLDLTKLVGSSIGPFEAWLSMRGLKTLPLRMRRQCDNALEIARRLQDHPKITAVHYPFLPDHPQHALMRELSGGRGAGGVLSFEIAGAGRKEVFAFMDALRLVQPATTLGDIYTLVLYPAMSSHRSLTPEERKALGIGDGLVRISAGIEDPADVIKDLERALAAA